MTPGTLQLVVNNYEGKGGMLQLNIPRCTEQYFQRILSFIHQFI